MKIKNLTKITFLFLLIVVAEKSAHACGACGCSLSNYNPELMVTSGYSSLSLLNTTRWFNAQVISDGHNPDGPLGAVLNYKQIQSVSELRGVYYPISKLELTADLPLNYLQFYLNNKRVETDMGLGDAILNADYTLLSETKKMKSKNIQQRLSVGAGIKMPTGQWKNVGYNEVWEPLRQNGTGSVDFVFNTAYFYRYHNGGINAFVSYKVNTMNADHYLFGNNFSTQVKGFYIAKVGRVSIMPNAGLALESSNADSWYNYAYWEPTGGTTLSGSIGADIYYKDFGFTLSYYQTMFAQLNGAELENKLRIQAGFKYVFSSKKKSDKAGKNP
jgi:hypothetical protein